MSKTTLDLLDQEHEVLMALRDLLVAQGAYEATRGEFQMTINKAANPAALLPDLLDRVQRAQIALYEAEQNALKVLDAAGMR